MEQQGIMEKKNETLGTDKCENIDILNINISNYYYYYYHLEGEREEKEEERKDCGCRK